jgi:hypothetical protein
MLGMPQGIKAWSICKRNQRLPSAFPTTATAYRSYMPKRQLQLSFPKVPTLKQRMLAVIEQSTHCVLSLDPKTLSLKLLHWYAVIRWTTLKNQLSWFA